MITPDYAALLARYNRWQNRSVISTASPLSDAERWLDRGGVFASIAETLNHVLWDDRVWLARLQGNTQQADAIGARHPYTATPTDWSDYADARAMLDDEIVTWAEGLTLEDLAQDVAWRRGADRVTTNFGFNLVHMFNHQTHHRGQVHGMLTAAGCVCGPTDLQMLPVDPKGR